MSLLKASLKAVIRTSHSLQIIERVPILGIVHYVTRHLHGSIKQNNFSYLIALLQMQHNVFTEPSTNDVTVSVQVHAD